MKIRGLSSLLIMCLLSSCAKFSVDTMPPFQLSGRSYLYDKNDWSFQGRLAVNDENQSISAAIKWKHSGHFDLIQLAGPFGQGRTVIEMDGHSVVIDNGKERIKYIGDLDNLFSKNLGINVPVTAFKFWVLGLADPYQRYDTLENGFTQSGWEVHYLQMQHYGEHQLPRKLNILKHQSRLKLLINQWQL